MTRKDYELIARALNDVLSGDEHGDEARPVHETVRNVAVELAINLRSTNPRFDVSRFLKACGFERFDG